MNPNPLDMAINFRQRFAAEYEILQPGPHIINIPITKVSNNKGNKTQKLKIRPQPHHLVQGILHPASCKGNQERGQQFQLSKWLNLTQNTHEGLHLAQLVKDIQHLNTD